MQKIVLHIFLMLVVVTANAQHYETWLDGDYNHRTRAAYSGGDISQSIDVASLSPGLHYYNIRTQDTHGMWSVVNRYLFMVPGMSDNSGPVRFESWLDSDYEGRTIRSYTGGDILDSASVASLTPGIHYYNIRVCDKYGVWGAVNRYLFLKTEVVRPVRISYWLDNDTLMSAEKAISGASVELSISLANQGAGQHTFNCQLQDNNGKWTPVYSYDFTIEQQKDTLTHEPVKAEYFIDTDPGYGQGIPLQRISTDTLHFVLSIEGLKAGAHMLYVRSADDGGKWSSTVAHPLYVSPVRQEQFVQMEYFFDDNDPGFGKATPLSDFAVGMEELVTMLSTDGLKAGAHLLNVRGQRANGLWTSVTSRSFLVIATEPLKPFVEYFFDSDPGYGKGVVIKDIEKGTNRLVIDLGNLPTGAHVLYVRSRDEEGQWSVTVCRPFYVCRRANLTALEYFFDNSDPGQGKATPIALPTTGGNVITFEVKLTGLSTGEHTLNVRAKGSDGLWRSLASEAFTLTAASGISTREAGQTSIAIFTLGGYKTNTPQQGVNIVRFKDGKTKKLIISNKTKN
jgi:hypothetical protein